MKGLAGRLLMMWLCCGGFSASGQATNGQQLAFGGVRFDQLEMTGLNQGGLTVTWKSGGQFRAGGVTLAFAEGWWWKGMIRMKASLNGTVVADCQVGPLKSGSFIVFVSAQSKQQCQGDASNSGADAAALQQWMLRGASKSRAESIKTMLGSAVDGWSCAKTLAKGGANAERACQGTPQEVLDRIR